MAWSAQRWRRFYAQERAALGDVGLAALVDAGEALLARAPAADAWVFPHARLAACGAQIAAAALATARRGADRVLALGVLHGGREGDRDAVARARAGDAAALARLRRVHGDGVVGDDGAWREEFSLDAFASLLPLAAERLGVRPPGLVARYPFLVRDEPATLAGLDELRALVADGCALVATADPVHHGIGYGTPRDACRDDRDAATVATARDAIAAQLAALGARDWPGFRARCAADASDFRDPGATLATLLPGSGEVVDLRLVDYAGTLAVERPTWVAAALIAWRRG